MSHTTPLREALQSTNSDPPNPPAKSGGATAQLFIDRKCPRCNQPPGAPCVDRSGAPRSLHRARLVEAGESWRTVTDELAQRTLREHPELDPDQVDGAVLTLRWACARGPFDDLPRPRLTVEAVREKVMQLYKHEAVGR